MRRLVGATRALTLCGAGGIGKTRLALRVLAGVADEFPDGAWFVDLGDLRQPDLVVSRIASVIGVSEEPGRPLLETLADALASRQMLLALDNCEHLIESSARVCQRLLASAPGLRLIATSREPLRVAAETVWQVQPLSVAPVGASAPEDVDRYEAIRLFAERAAASLSGFAVTPANVAVVAALCRALDGIPLAIELAAARVRALSVEQIFARLVDRFSLLTTGSRGAPPRQQTLRAAIDWSYGLLTGPEQVLLRRLSVFAGWSLEMAEQVCSDNYIQAADILDLITALVDKSLVVRETEVLGQARYRLLDTIREYAAVCLVEAGESPVFRGRLRDYTMAVAEDSLAVGMALAPAPWSARVDVFRRYDVEMGNVWQVLTHCLADTDVETGLRICTAVRPCWLVRGTFAEGTEWLDSFLALDVPDVSPEIRGAALIGRAQLALSSDRTAAEPAAEEGLELCRGAKDDFWTASGLNLLAEIALHTGRIDEAASCADEALSVAQAAGDGWNEGYALGVRAAIAGLQGRLREAQQLAKASIAVMRRIDQQWGVARGLLGLGDLARVRRDPDDAHSRYLEALAILREIDARPEIARCLAGLGRVAMELGRPGAGQAAPHREPAAESFHRVAHRRGAWARGLRRAGRARGPAGAGGAADRGGHGAARRGRPGRAVRRAGGAVPGVGAPSRRAGGHPAVVPGPGAERRCGGRAGHGRPAAGRDAARPADRARARRGATGAARHTDPAGAAGRGAGRPRQHEQGDRRGAVHQPGHRRPACGEHHDQAGLQHAGPDRRLGHRQAD